VMSVSISPRLLFVRLALFSAKALQPSLAYGSDGI
jgi:hypothetical protein